MTGLHGTGDFKRFYWTTGTVVPTCAGLGPMLVAEKLNLSYFAKAPRSF